MTEIAAMRPRHTLLAVGLMLVLAYAARGVFLWYRFFPSEPDDLRQAVSLRVHYYSSSRGLTYLDIEDPAQVADTLAALRVFSTERQSRYYSYGGSQRVRVDFVFADGSTVYTQIGEGPDRLYRRGPILLTIDPAFYAKIRALILQADRNWSDPVPTNRMKAK
jgi:hypothetical protein